MSPSARWRAVHVELWHEPSFVRLTADEQRIALYLLCGPQTNPIGTFRLSAAMAAEDLNISMKVFLQRLTVVCRAFAWRYDASARVLRIPEWIRGINRPRNPNGVKAWRAAFREVPDCPLKDETARAIVAFLQTKADKSFLAAWANDSANDSANSWVNGSGNTPSTSPSPSRDGATEPRRAARQRLNGMETGEVVRLLQARRTRSG